MSWIFAVSKHNAGSSESLSVRHETPLYTLSLSDFYIAVGGNTDTCLWAANPAKSIGWAVVGIGISKSESSASILTRDDWAKLLDENIFDPTSIDGHFIVLRWNNNEVECFTDQIGLRTLYYGKCTHGTYISTRLDWVAHATGLTEVDFAALGSRWLMLNQMSYESCVVGIERIGPGGYARFRSGSLIIAGNTLWTPEIKPDTPEIASDRLKAILMSVVNHRYIPSLGLSGGLDSRVLMALLINLSGGRYFTHTFGDPDNPDVQVARRITADLKLPHYYIHDVLPDVQTCIRDLSNYVAQVILTEPCTSFINLRYYRKIRDLGRMLIDGGFGEIARRQFLNRVVRFGQSALRSHNISRLFALMRLPRADIFSRDTTLSMETGARGRLNDALDGMPSLEEIGVENFADLFTVRMRIPNYGGSEQARLDSEILNFMPMAQPSFLHAVFRIPVKFRTNVGLHYGIIRELNPSLMRFPLVKSGFVYKFGLNKNFVYLASKLKSKFSRGYSDPGPDSLLNHIKEFVLDIVHSREITCNKFYDSEKIISAVTKYYKGERALKREVVWLLTFELWRRSLSTRDS